MAKQDYYTQNDSKSSTLFGLLGTTLIHGSILAALLFMLITPPNPPLEFEGMKMLLGEENMGGPNTEPAPNPSAQTEQLVPITAEEDPPSLSQNTDDVGVEERVNKDIKRNEIIKPKHEPKLDLPKKETPVIEPERVVNSKALFKKGNKTGQDGGGYGSGDIPGNEGRYNGSPDGSPNGTGLGDYGLGTGKDGIHIEIDRKAQRLPSIEDNSKETGRVVVSIVVDRKGNVVKAIPGQKGTTTLSPALLEKARQGALQTKFVESDDADAEQYGTMTFIFRFQP